MHVPGPKEIYVKFADSVIGHSGGTDWQFVGTCVQAPDLSTQPYFIDVFNDYGGRRTPYQLIWDGSESRVMATVNRMDLAVCRNIRDQAERVGTLGRVGRETNLDRGTLVIGKSDFQMIVRNTYFGTVNATIGMPPGRYFFSVVLEGYEEHTTGTRVEEVSMLFRCNNIFLGANGFAQFTEDPIEFPALLPN